MTGFEYSMSYSSDTVRSETSDRILRARVRFGRTRCGASVREGNDVGITIAVQERQRFYREGLVMVLDAEPDLAVAGSAADAKELVRVFGASTPDVVLLELDASEWDPFRLTGALRRRRRGLIVVGIAPSTDRILATNAAQAGMRAVVAREGGIPALLQAVRLGPGRLTVSGLRPARRSYRSTRDDGPAAPVRNTLTPRQLEVLTLVGGGLTTREISCELGISAKTVENHKQRIFERLGVNNQAHAVATAMRLGSISSGVALRRVAQAS